MKSKIILKSSSPVLFSQVATRRDITSLTAEELRAYQDAWREIQTNGVYADLAGYHDCPRGFCHKGDNDFVAWHREYLYRLEAALRAVDPAVALHYWDWTSRTSIASGIPPAFTAPEYVSLKDGNTYRNPLRAFRFQCGGEDRYTIRSPGRPAALESYARSVRRTYQASTYVTFDRYINGPHGSLHVWVGEDMSTTEFASYDPIFWAHHSNVDRQWASWQRGGGADPPSSIAAQTLLGFAGRKVGDVVSISALNYRYDRYDSVRRFVPFTIPAFQPQGVFPNAMSNAQEESFELLATGIPAHPRKSWSFKVFVNDDNATLGDAIKSNENFVGSFGIFGGPSGHDKPSDDERSVLVFSPKIQAKLRDLQKNGKDVSIKLIAVDQDGKEAPISSTPIKNVSVRKSDDTGTKPAMPSEEASERFMRNLREQLNIRPASLPGSGFNPNIMGGIKGGGTKVGGPTTGLTKSEVKGPHVFTGISSKESFDEAYRNAVDEAQEKLGVGGDQELVIQVAQIQGVRGTIAGKTELKVTILVTVK